MQEPFSELVTQSSVRASKAGLIPEQTLQPADTMPALQLERPESQMGPQRLSSQAEHCADSTCEGPSTAGITADHVELSSDTDLPHTAQHDASALMKQDHPVILQQYAADETVELAGQHTAQHTSLSIDADVSFTRAEEEGQQEHSIVPTGTLAPAPQDAGRDGQPPLGSSDGHAVKATPNAAAGGVGNGDALTDQSFNSAPAHILASIPTDALKPPVHHSEDLEGHAACAEQGTASKEALHNCRE